MSRLVFDGDELSLKLYDGSGKQLGAWPASNFGGPSSDHHTTKKEAYITWVPDGQYPFEKPSQHVPQRHHKHELDQREGTYGSLGILKLAPIKFGGQIHSGVGIHAGREHVKDTRTISKTPPVQGHFGGPYHRTNGCIRTTEAAMHAIASVIAKDPLTRLNVQNNGEHPTGKVEGSDAKVLSR